MNLEEMLRGSPLNQQRMADDNAMNLAGMLARGRAGTISQEPNMVDRGLSNVKRLFYGDKNIYGNDPINPSVLDSQYVSPEMAEGAVLDFVGGPMTFAGIGSRTANKLALQKAKDLAGQGVNRKQIWDETGWFNDVDGKWKYEIDDSGAKIDQKLGGETVGANLKHDDLYRAYPGLKRAKLHHMGNPYDVGGGSWRDPGSTRYGEMLLRPDKTASGTKSTALHELQHAIQGREKFGKGGSPEAFVMSGKKQKEAMKHLEFAVGSRRWIEYKKHFGDPEGKGWADFRKIYKSNMGKYPPREAKDATSHVPLYAQDDLHAQLVDMEQNISQSLQDAQDPLRSYYLLAGEAEARNAQTRMGLTPKQRKAKPPWETLDVPEEELLVRMLQEGPSLATAWHGSPHKFSKFDMSKIGTGEGAQAYGHGLYFAENPETAKAYKDMLRPLTDIEDLRVGGIPLYRQGQPVDYSPNRGAYGQRIEKPTEDDYARAVLQEDMLINEWKFKDAFDKEGLVGARKRMREVVSDRLQSAKEEWPESVPFLESTLAKLDKDIGNKMKFNEYDSYLYKVDIPDDQIAKMLDWDKTLSEQSKSVKESLKRYGVLRSTKPITQSTEPNGRIIFRDERGKMVATAIPDGKRYKLSSTTANLEGFSLNRPAVDKKQAQKVAEGWWSGNNITGEQLVQGMGRSEEGARALRKHGIPGIKYLDGGSRTGGKGTSNFVLFADDIAKILERNDQPIGDLAEELQRR